MEKGVEISFDYPSSKVSLHHGIIKRVHKETPRGCYEPCIDDKVEHFKN
jgi:hypothetical protein